MTASGVWTLNNTAALVFDNVTINHNNSTTQGSLGVNAPVTLQNGAVINNTWAWTMNNATFTQGAGAAGAFNNNAGGTVTIPAGGSAVFGTGITFTNLGTLTATGNLVAGTLVNAATLDFTGLTITQNVTNNGTMQVITGGVGMIAGDVVNNSQFNITGTAYINGTVTDSTTGAVNLDNGTLNVLHGRRENGTLRGGPG